MTQIERRTRIDGVPPPTGPYVWSARWGDLIFISGLRGVDEATGQPAPTDEERLALIFNHLKRILDANGATVCDVVSSRVYVTDMVRHRPLVNEAFLRFFGDTLPTRTIVEVARLNQDDTIEVEVIAVRHARRDQREVQGG
jgi:enamine deaminase RidA (YjgF/YER057c/UK114 family)